MPRLDTFTAQGRDGIVNVAPTSASSFGGQVAQPLSQFGQVMENVADKLQQQRDDLDMADRAGHFDQKVAEKYQEILTSKEPALRGNSIQDTARLRANALHKWAREHFDGLSRDGVREVQGEDGNPTTMEVPAASKTVRNAMEQYILKSVSTHTVNMQADVLKSETERQGHDAIMLAQHYADIAAREPMHEDSNLSLMRQNFARMGESGLFDQKFLDTQQASAEDRFWRQKAIHSPDRVKALVQEIRSGHMDPDRAHIDQSKIHEYENLAQNTINNGLAQARHEEAERHAMEKRMASEEKNRFFSMSVSKNLDGSREFSLDALIDHASKSTILHGEMPETIRYLQTLQNHEAQAKDVKKFDEPFFIRKLLPGIYAGRYRNELDVLQASGDRLDASHATQAIEQFHKYKSIATAQSTQDFHFGQKVIDKTFALPPGASIDQTGVLAAGGRAMDRFSTWYSSLVERAVKEGPKVFAGIDVMAEARRIRDEEFATLKQNLITITEQAPLKYKTPDEVKSAHKEGKLSTREANLHLQEILSRQQIETQEPVPPPKPKAGGDRRIGKD